MERYEIRTDAKRQVHLIVDGKEKLDIDPRSDGAKLLEIYKDKNAQKGATRFGLIIRNYQPTPIWRDD